MIGWLVSVHLAATPPPSFLSSSSVGSSNLQTGHVFLDPSQGVRQFGWKIWPQGINIPSEFILICSTQMVHVGGSKCILLLFPAAFLFDGKFFFSSYFLFLSTLLILPAATTLLLQCFSSILITVSSSIAFYDALFFLAFASASPIDMARTKSRSCSSGLNCCSKFDTKLFEETPSKARCILKN